MKKLKSNPVPVGATIEKFSHDGRGIARINGKTTFIEGSLPGEEVTFIYTRKKSDFDEGKLFEVIKPSPHRVKALCPNYTVCGGCSLQHLDEEKQIEEKQQLLLDLLSRIGHCQPEKILPPLKASAWNYRNKARLSVRYVEKKQSTLVGFRERDNPRYIADIEECPVLNRSVGKEIKDLRCLINSFDNPRNIAQVEVAIGQETALIFRNLNALLPTDEDKLREYAIKRNFRIFLQPAGPDSVYLFHPKEGSSFLQYKLPAQKVQFEFHPTDFTQVNEELNQLMVAQALQLLELNEDDTVLDLFCGLGNFTLPMAKQCHQVVGVEGSEGMVNRAYHNAKLNDITNVEFFAANLEESTIFKQLKKYNFTKLLLDPPRTGALNIVTNIQNIKPHRIVYVSCNPSTLARDSDILINQQGYRLLSAGVMDMFPHTAHVESIAVFEKR
ncbi:23S rRNA (uracil-5-)-methyltransferase RumA (plasmid) [Legionella adelaidensis]|uniref:23S rRNA (uracil(1939)-C(5))-methyltransferase RlmD n=1 Tax=Legionella adelaidensis TaxID=45056 RepID=A0A0W0R4F5_9GAMM|nr:23S rRNA (uracil(1939)-C(5))-methyltransferase RlmD [Legionella adelaidensis]KTC65927.1 23S rRNA 5-methyluridine methyltransferase [Legionella adelaidensis]VEH85547.1 23S rRNA (uracil-5-)-methyltransferase RumA [Legionella adelaidensis]